MIRLPKRLLVSTSILAIVLGNSAALAVGNGNGNPIFDSAKLNNAPAVGDSSSKVPTTAWINNLLGAGVGNAISQATGSDIGAQANTVFANYGATPLCGWGALPYGVQTFSTAITGIGSRQFCQLGGQGLGSRINWTGSAAAAIPITANQPFLNFGKFKDFFLSCQGCTGEGITGVDIYQEVFSGIFINGFPGGPTVAAGAFSNGNTYKISVAGSTSFTSIGASANTVGTIFTATGAGTGTGKAISLVTAGSFAVNQSYQIDSIGSTDYTAIGANSNTLNLIFTATGVGTGTGTAHLRNAAIHFTGDNIAADNTGNNVIAYSYFNNNGGDGILLDGTGAFGGVAAFDLFGINAQGNGGAGIDSMNSATLNQFNVWGGDLEGNLAGGLVTNNWHGSAIGTYIENNTLSALPSVSVTGIAQGIQLSNLYMLGNGGLSSPTTPYCMIVKNPSTSQLNGGVIIEGNYCTGASMGYDLLLPGGGTFGPNAGTVTATFEQGSAGISANMSAQGVAIYRWVDTVGAGKWSSDDLVYARGFVAASAAPNATVCGTGPTFGANSTNNGGSFTTGTGSPTACTINFASNGVVNPFPNAAYCTISPANAAALATTAYVFVSSKTEFVVEFGAALNSAAFNYTCMGS